MSNTREQIRDLYDLIYWIKNNASVRANPEKKRNTIRYLREQIAGLQIKLVDELEKPITEEWRHIYMDEMGESGRYYVILPDEGETDDELSEWFDQCVAYPPINSPYDCTGKRFTWLKHIKRTPAGIVVIHGWALDV